MSRLGNGDEHTYEIDEYTKKKKEKKAALQIRSRTHEHAFFQHYGILISTFIDDLQCAPIASFTGRSF